MNRRRLLLGGLSLTALTTIPLRTLAQEKKPENLAQENKSGRLTTHVLDTMSGKPAAGMRIDFSVWEGDRYRLLDTVYTNKDGRTDKPLLIGNAMTIGRYEELFYVAEYYTKLGVALPNPPFLDKVPLRFAISDAGEHYHVPLLCTPWSYTTYRGS